MGLRCGLDGVTEGDYLVVRVGGYGAIGWWYGDRFVVLTTSGRDNNNQTIAVRLNNGIRWMEEVVEGGLKTSYKQ